MTKPTKWLCAQWRLRSAWASVQSDQSRCCALNVYLRVQAFIMWTAMTLIRLGGCPGWSESSLGAHSLCWFFLQKDRYHAFNANKAFITTNSGWKAETSICGIFQGRNVRDRNVLGQNICGRNVRALHLSHMQELPRFRVQASLCIRKFCQNLYWSSTDSLCGSRESFRLSNTSDLTQGGRLLLSL